jgi:hypothetical protein
MDFSFLHLDNVVVMLLSAGSVYGAIRMDIKNIHEKINTVKESSNEAHKRIDAILMQKQ